VILITIADPNKTVLIIVTKMEPVSMDNAYVQEVSNLHQHVLMCLSTKPQSDQLVVSSKVSPKINNLYC